MKDRRYIDIFSSEGMKNVNEERKMKKFFRWAVPILVIELIVILGITAYFFILPKNYCEVSINNPNAIVYIKDKESRGELLVIRPETELPVSKVEKDPEKLKAAYEIGRKNALARLDEIRDFLSSDFY